MMVNSPATRSHDNAVNREEPTALPVQDSVFDDASEQIDGDASGSGYYRYQPGKGIVFVAYTPHAGRRHSRPSTSDAVRN